MSIECLTKINGSRELFNSVIAQTKWDGTTTIQQAIGYRKKHSQEYAQELDVLISIMTAIENEPGMRLTNARILTLLPSEDIKKNGGDCAPL